MKINLTICNEGALPIAYIIRKGETLSAHQLYKDKPLHLNAFWVKGTEMGQVRVQAQTEQGKEEKPVHLELIFQPSPDLLMRIV